MGSFLLTRRFFLNLATFSPLHFPDSYFFFRTPASFECEEWSGDGVDGVGEWSAEKKV